ncbi:MAG: hypothetical protein H6865_05530 [Rhodospirillales bacterium]|nr:hypothetical protein [Rhodospirillales bacterium]USO08156.1 MAG: hypothetical protein H6866_02765 [Rhodospirillales bacterium]
MAYDPNGLGYGRRYCGVDSRDEPVSLRDLCKAVRSPRVIAAGAVGMFVLGVVFFSSARGADSGFAGVAPKYVPAQTLSAIRVRVQP